MVNRFPIIQCIAVLLPCLMAGPLIAQTDEEIQQQTRAIQAEVAAAREATAQRGQISKVMDDIRFQLSYINACLAQAAKGSYISQEYEGCAIWPQDYVRSQIATKVFLGDMKVQDVPGVIRTLRAQTQSTVKALKAQQTRLQAELTLQQKRYANVHMPARTDPTATVKPQTNTPASSTGASQASQEDSNVVGGCQSVSANSCNAGATKGGCLARNQIKGFYGIPWEWCGPSSNGNPCKNVSDPKTGAELHRCM